MKRAKDLAALLMSAAALVSSLTGLVKAFHTEDEVKAADKDRAYLWDDHGDQWAEVEKLKEQIAALEAAGGRR